MAEAVEHPDSDFSDDEPSPLDKSFYQAAAHTRNITDNLNNNQLLRLYGLFKQANEGKCNVPKPSWLDSRGRRKWEAWRANGDMTTDEAKQKYTELVRKLDPELSIESDAQPKESWVTVSSLRISPEPDLDVNKLSILEAAREDCSGRLTELLNLDPSLKDERDEDGLSALHWAADRDSTDALSAAILGGCSVDALDNSGQSALHYAVSCGHKNATRILLDAGASPTLQDDEGNTPIDMATDIDIKELLEKQTKPNVD